MQKKVSAQEFYTAGTGMMLIFLLAVMGILFFYEKVIKKDELLANNNK